MSAHEADIDPPEVQLHLFSRSGKLVFDIGGNYGSVAKQLTRRFDRVVSCEPAEESFSSLVAVPGIIALQVAVTDHVGSVELAVQADHIKQGQLSSPSGGDDAWLQDRESFVGGWGRILDARTVPATTVDALAEEYGDPDLIKCDVEGHEGRVFAGALQTVERARPALFIEIHNKELGAEIRGYLDPFYPDLHEVWHPYYKPGEFGAANHYWLVADQG